MSLVEEIKDLARKKNALILAHNYQLPEVQDVADMSGDSLELARMAAGTDAVLLIFCGVHFMAESASILSPSKKVVIPDPTAGCPMADMATAEDLVEMKKVHPRAAVVTYINSTAEVKGESDVICTSSNALKIVESVEADEVIFVPDRNLAAYVQRFTKKKIIPWNGFCPTHERFTLEDLEAVRKAHPDALVMVHPECRPDVIDRSDRVLSTGQMVAFVKETNAKKIIVGTEIDMLHRLRGVAPGIEFIPATASFVCPNMKKIDLPKIARALRDEETVVSVDPVLREKAKRALDRMLELSG